MPHRTLLCLTVRCCASLVHGLAGADPAPANSDGYTALHIAAQMGYVNGVQLLLEAGCSQQLFNISTARLLAICLMAICLLAICLMAMPLVPTDHLDFLRIVYRPSGLYIDHLDFVLTIWTVYRPSGLFIDFVLGAGAPLDALEAGSKMTPLGIAVEHNIRKVHDKPQDGVRESERE